MEQREQSLEDIRRAIVQVKARQLTINDSQYTALTNALTRLLDKEANMLKALEDTEQGWATSRQFRELTDLLFATLSKHPKALEDVRAALATFLNSDERSSQSVLPAA
jgi:hypothetical protein